MSIESSEKRSLFVVPRKHVDLACGSVHPFFWCTMAVKAPAQRDRNKLYSNRELFPYKEV